MSAPQPGGGGSPSRPEFQPRLALQPRPLGDKRPHHFFRLLGSFAVFVLAALPLASHAASAPGSFSQTHRGDGAKLTVTSPSTQAPRFGFLPVRLSIDNQQTRDVTWQATFNMSGQFGNVTSSQRATESFAVPGGRSHERWLFAPVVDSSATSGAYFYRGPFNGSIRGPGLGQMTFYLGGSSGPSNNQMVPWAVSQSLEVVVRTRITTMQSPTAPVARGRPRPGVPPGSRPFVASLNLSVFDPVESLGDWRVWSPFARVLMRTTEFAAFDPANRVALRNWVALGGMLYLVPETAGPGATQRFGAGQIRTLAAPITAVDLHDNGGLFAPEGLLTTTLAQPGSGDLSLELTEITKKAPKAEPPGDWLVYFFIGFTVIVAPVNLFALAPARRRHRLFFTVPLISFVGVAVLSVIIFLQDGTGGTGARRALVVLLPGDNQAAVFQDQVSRTGLLFGSAFPLAADTICTQVAVDYNAQASRGPSFERGDGLGGGDWFRSRARQGQHLRRLTPTRARVERVGTAPDGAPIVQSSVGTMLSEFCYVDSAGVVWGAASVPPGTRVNLTRIADGARFAQQVRQFGQASLHFTSLAISSAFAGDEPRGRFIALAGDSELAPLPTLAAITWTDSRVMFTGIVENAAATPAVERSVR